MERKVTDYFRKLSELLLSLQVTDGEGGTLSLENGVERAVEMVLSFKSAPGKVIIIGNGGSASTAGHLQNDFFNLVGIRAMVVTEAAQLTAISNDFGYGSCFERPVKQWADIGDLLIAISGSGKSENVLRAVQAGIARGCKVITCSGIGENNPLRRMGHLNFYVPSRYYGYVELAHSALAHYLIDAAATHSEEIACPAKSVVNKSW
ncbi:MAG: SIS domain-containing protein [Armatimonadetes bacterium]|nr:SIS domain-containing protein [Armatimonadota bacterium]